LKAGLRNGFETLRDFSKWGREVQMASNFASNVEMQESLATILNLKNSNKLIKGIVNATDLGLASINKYTANGNIILLSLRNGNETIIDAVNFTEFQLQLYNSIENTIVEFQKTDRLVLGQVIRGRTYPLADFKTLFNSGNENVPLKGIVSCTKNRVVAIDFLSKSGQNISGPKVKVILNIKSKYGVYIDDISDWGVNLIEQKHPGELVQDEVIMNEGYFKQIGEPKRILNIDGSPKRDIDGTEWFEVELEELGIKLRNINWNEEKELFND